MIALRIYMHSNFLSSSRNYKMIICFAWKLECHTFNKILKKSITLTSITDFCLSSCLVFFILLYNFWPGLLCLPWILRGDIFTNTDYTILKEINLCLTLEEQYLNRKWKIENFWGFFWEKINLGDLKFTQNSKKSKICF